MKKNIITLTSGIPLYALFFLLITYHVSMGQNFTDSNLPIVIINTDGEAEIPDDPKVWADMIIINRTDDQRNKLTDQTNEEILEYSGRIKIETRGSSSQTLDKKQFALTTYHDDEEDKDKVSLFDMARDNDWILGGIAFDSSLVRDYISYNLFRQMGQYAPRLVYCEVILNGSYNGLYLLTEKIKIDDDKVDIDEISETAISLPDLTGGYLTKADKVDDGDPAAWINSDRYGGSITYIHVHPDPDEALAEQTNYIKSIFGELENTTEANNESLSTGYPSVIDIPSFIDFMLINELSSNVDGYQYSTYFHKDKNGKLKAGPIWDFNLTYGNDLGFMWGIFFDRSHTDIWQFDNNDNVGSTFWYDLYNNDTYKCYMSRRWNELTLINQPLNETSVNEFIDETVTYISEAADREEERWGSVGNHANEIQKVKSFITERITWMNENLGSFDACSDITTPNLVISKIHYNPSSEGTSNSSIEEFIEITNNGSSTVDATGIYFGGYGLVYQFPAGSSIDAGEKIALANSSSIYKSKYGTAAFDEYTRNLSNGGETILLLDGFGNEIDKVSYQDETPWPDADGNGFYLSLIDPNLDNNDPDNWTTVEDIAFTLDTQHNTLIELNIYPNPSNEQLNIHSEQVIELIRVMDINGRTLLQSKPNSIEGIVNITSLNMGVYLLEINTESDTFIRKIIKK